MNLDELFQLMEQHQDEKYADFTAKLIPNVSRDRMIGIRSPEYKKILKGIKGDPVIPEFLHSLPHTRHEENCLHSALINQLKDYDACIKAVEEFLPYVDNWAVCDGLNPACFRKNHSALIHKVQEWIASEAPYTRRFGMHILMAHFLDEDFQPSFLDQPADLRSGEYYVNMMTAWLFAEALAKQWAAVVPYIEQHKLDAWTHNKTIQKALESRKISDEQKAYLKTLRVK